MDPFKRGVKNVLRNSTRSVAVIIILSLAVGLSLVMVVARQSVDQKISSIKSSVGNTITIAPAGFSNFSSLNNDLTTSQLSKIKNVDHVTSLSESLSDRLTTIGSSQPSFGFNSNSSNSTNQTSLTSPVTINLNNVRRHFFNASGSSAPTNFSLPITIIGTNNPYQVNQSTISITEGKIINGSSDNNNVIVSTSMASKNSLKVGSNFKAFNSTLNVVGIFKTTTKALGNTIVVPLSTLERLTSQSGAVTSAIATVDTSNNLSSTTSAIKKILGSNADVQNSQQQANATIQPLQSVKTIAVTSLIGSLIAGAIIIFLIMLLLVRERKREIGVLKALGASNVKVIKQFTSEATTLTLLAAILGIIIGGLAAGPITSTLINNTRSNNSSPTSFVQRGALTRQAGGGFAGPRFFSGRGFGGSLRANLLNVHAEVGWSIILYGLAVAIIIAFIGSSLASYLIANVRPAEVLRSE